MVRSRFSLSSEDFSYELPKWETSLGVRFAADDFARAETVGDVWAVVERRLLAHGPWSTRPACTTQRTFYRLRRALAEVAPRQQVLAPGTSLAAAFPWRTRPAQWQRLGRASGLPVPGLHFPIPAFLLTWAASTAAVWISAPHGALAVAAGLCSALVVGSWSWTHVALPTATLGELATNVVAGHYRQLADARPQRAEVRALVLRGLLDCSSEDEACAAAELGDETAFDWTQ
ncbi:hypothetical protein [Hymenobacter terrestris]|uniref:Uncharacterized protein n=1 Tax=Hymenobacter terrestris TaxID=2748310 RepID=A0ABX2Q7Z4_9BACT|nr:hypothetical protein [Hymenobacter terrestris]NVO86709.1 hypothetical protein [Hymenobacter terrestris]